MPLPLVTKHALASLDAHGIQYKASGNTERTSLTFSHDQLDKLAEALGGVSAGRDHECEFDQADIDEARDEGKSEGRAAVLAEIKDLVEGVAA